MTDALALDSRDVALELHSLLRDLDPSRWRDEMEQAFRSRLVELEAQLSELQINFNERLVELEHRISEQVDLERREMRRRLEEQLSELLEALREHWPEEDLKGADLRADWEAFRRRMQPAYEELAGSLRAGHMVLPTLRPTNYGRSILHLASAMTSLLLVELVFSANSLIWLAGAACAAGWAMEIGRKRSPRFNDFLMSFMHHVAHPHEWNRVNSSTWYTVALLGLALTRQTWICAIGVVVLGVGDPLAALVGRRWGRIKLVNNRSLEGTTTFILSAGLAGFAALLIFHPEFGRSTSLAIAFAAAVAGGLAELYSHSLDDNLTIPLASASGGILAAMLFGII